jgi:LL-diaminopimelate aminotransferase
MATINHNYDKLAAGYLFPEIAKRTRAFQAENPDACLMKLGIGNTTEALTPHVVGGLYRGVERLAERETYSGYGDDRGDRRLRESIAQYYAGRDVVIDADEILVSDGAKPDSGNIQSIFGINNVVAVQDPSYPVYVDTNVIAGRTGRYDTEEGLYDGIVYMPCTEDNEFFPAIPDKKLDLIYLCSPNNPTGAVATRRQLARFVDYARKNRAVIIFDAAYAAFIRDETLPRSIYEIERADECAIEINSFSKMAGFTGVRLGWTVVPQALVCENTEPGELSALWFRRQCTFFNGASNIVQEGGIAALSPQGRKESQQLVDYYMANAVKIRDGLQDLGLTVFGGINAPYIWMKTPGEMTSWQFFDKLLSETHVVGTPGSGFGPSGEGYFRLSAFGHAEDIETAMLSIRTKLKL